MSFAKVTILGNLGRDPELKTIGSGTQVCNFSMAATERRRQNGQQVDVTTWFAVTCFDRLAEIAAQYLEKGKQVFVEGRITQEEWTDRDGNKRSTLRVTASDIQFVGSAQDGQRRQMAAAASAPASVSTAQADDPSPADDLDDVPF